MRKAAWRKPVLTTFLSLALVYLCAGNAAAQEDDKNGDIVILYTNDVHCGVDDNLGYAALAGYKAQPEGEYAYVTLVDIGWVNGGGIRDSSCFCPPHKQPHFGLRQEALARSGGEW